MGTTFLVAIRLLLIFFPFPFFSVYFFFLNFQRVPKPKMNLILSMTFLAIAASAIAIRENDDVIESEMSRAAIDVGAIQREIYEFQRKLRSGQCSRNNPTPCCSYCHLCEYCKNCSKTKGRREGTNFPVQPLRFPRRTFSLN